MQRYKDAYIEAFHIMLKQNAFKTLNSEFGVENFLISNGWEKDYLKKREEFLKLEGYSEFEIKFAEIQSNTEWPFTE